MDINIAIAGCIEEAELAAEGATRELINAMKRYQLAPDGTEAVKQAAYKAAREKADAAKGRGLELIDAKIAELDAAEVKAAEKRAADTDYMDRLQMKIRMVESVDLQTQDNATLKALFAEFANDSLAIGLIRSVVPGMRSAIIEPPNSNGKKQEHLQEIRRAFIRAMDKAAAYISPSDLENGSIPWRNEVEALRAYIAQQNSDFSLSDKAIWAAVAAKTPGYALATKDWQMRIHELDAKRPEYDFSSNEWR